MTESLRGRAATGGVGAGGWQARRGRDLHQPRRSAHVRIGGLPATSRPSPRGQLRQPLQPARGDGGRAVRFHGAGEQHVAAPPPAWRSHAPPGRCRVPAVPGPALRASGARTRDRRRRARGQVPSFNPPRMVRSKRCSRASSGPRMARRGWRPKRGAHRHLHRQRAEQRRDRRAARWAADPAALSWNASTEQRGGLAIGVAPEQAISRRRRRQGASAAARWAAIRSASGTSRFARSIFPAAPGSRRRSPTSAPAPRRSPRCLCCALRRRRWRSRWQCRPGPDRGAARASAKRSSARAMARNAARSSPRLAKGCLSSASSGTGANSRLRRFRQQAEKRAGAGMGQRAAGGIVDGDVPASQFAGDAPRQVAVRRHQRGGAAVLSPGSRATPARWPALPAPDRRRRPARCRPGPARCRRRRASASARQASVVGAGRRVSRSRCSRAGLVQGAVPVLHVARAPRRCVQQLLQAILRMTGIERAPAFLVQRRGPAPAAPARPWAGAR